MRWLLALLLLSAPPALAQLAVGSSRIELPEPTGVTAAPLPVWLHRPASWRPDGPVLVVMHGVGRDADRYRDHWRPLAERHGLLLLAPEFSTAKYPGAAWYNNGGAVAAGGQPRPRAQWSFFAIDRAAAAVRRMAGAPPGGFLLYGHSAGAQFVHRYLLLTGAPMASGIAIANAGSYTLPRTDLSFPQGLAGLDSPALGPALSRPALLALGEADTDPAHPALPHQPWAEAQGPHRLARGHFFFAAAQEAASRAGVALGWRLLLVPGVGHSDSGMAPAVLQALLAQR